MTLSCILSRSSTWYRTQNLNMFCMLFLRPSSNFHPILFETFELSIARCSYLGPNQPDPSHSESQTFFLWFKRTKPTFEDQFRISKIRNIHCIINTSYTVQVRIIFICLMLLSYNIAIWRLFWEDHLLSKGVVSAAQELRLVQPELHNQNFTAGFLGPKIYPPGN